MGSRPSFSVGISEKELPEKELPHGKSQLRDEERPKALRTLLELLDPAQAESHYLWVFPITVI